MQGKIALEDHFAIQPRWPTHSIRRACLARIEDRLHRFPGQAAAAMDKDGIEIMIAVAQCAGGAGDPGVKQAIAMAKQGERHACGRDAKRPDRFAGFAALPMQDPDERAELTRCVKDLGFVGALVNGFSQTGSADSVTLLRPAAIPAVLERGRELDVPFYMHPRNPLPGWNEDVRRPQLDAWSELGFQRPRPPCTESAACCARCRHSSGCSPNSSAPSRHQS